MGFAYCVEEHDDHLRFTSRGAPSSPQEMFQYVHFMFNKTRQSGFNRVLVDESRSHIKLGFHEAIVQTKLLDIDEFLRLDLRVAIVCASHCLDVYKHFESQVREQRFSIKIFDGVEDGLSWLKIAEPR